MGTRFLKGSPWGHASHVTQALPFAVWAAPAESRTGRRYVLAAGASRGNPPPALGCGRSADSRSRYVSCEPGQAWRGAKPGAAARPRGYLFIRGQLRAQAPWAWLWARLGALVGGGFTLLPGCLLAVWINFTALWLQRGCDLWSAVIAPRNFC